MARKAKSLFVDPSSPPTPPPFAVADNDFVKSGWCGNRPKCVTVAVRPQGVAVRDSKDPEKTTLYFSHDEFRAFVQGVKSGQFDV